MKLEVFTDAWAEAWAEELRASEPYRKAAKSWEGSLLLEMHGESELKDNETRAVFLDLWHGDCRAVRLPREEDRRTATFVIGASVRVWRQILENRLEPLLGLMSGKLTLTRGSLSRLLPHVSASRELVAAATRIESIFPDSEGDP